MAALSNWDWPERFLLVRVRNGGSTYTYLLKHVTQEEFITYYIAQMATTYRLDRVEAYTKIVELAVEDLSEDVYDLLEPFYEAVFKLEG